MYMMCLQKQFTDYMLDLFYYNHQYSVLCGHNLVDFQKDATGSLIWQHVLIVLNVNNITIPIVT